MSVVSLCFLTPYGELSASQTTTRIKDIVTFEGVRDNQLVGYGLVVGLQGTGDDSRRSPLKESLAAMLERLGVKIDLTAQASGGLNTKNAAVVMVTASLPPFSRHGTRIDVTVSAMADAKSLMGGVLLPTPLRGADGETYVLAQGPVTAGGYSLGGGKRHQQQVTKGVPTNGRVPGGGIVEKEIPFELAQQKSLRIMLRNPDFTTAKRISDAINKKEGKISARATDPGTVVLNIEAQKHNLVAFLTRIEQLTVVPDQQARIVVDDRDGVVVINENVRIAPVAVAHGSLTVKITDQDQVSQPQGMTGFPPYYGAFGIPPNTQQTMINNTIPQQSGVGATASPTSTFQQSTTGLTSSSSNTLATADEEETTEKSSNKTSTSARFSSPQLLPWIGTAVTRTTSIDVDQGEGQKLCIVAPGATLQDLVNALNGLGCSPRDLITILQGIKQAGALQAKLESM